MIKEHLLSFEYSVLIVFATLGMLLMLAANDFLSLFVSLEIQGLSLYLVMIIGTFSGLLCLRGKGSYGVQNIEVRRV